MHGVLDRIIETKRREVEAGKGRVSVDEFKAQARDLPRPRNFFSALSHDPTLNIRNPKILNVIAEVKKASPSAGVMKADFDPVQIAKDYAAAGADALSVLTDEPYFQGKLEYLHAVKKEVDLPILRKDFIVDPWQIYESRVAGADAILLIVAALEQEALRRLQKRAWELELAALVEVHDAEELDRAVESEARLIGVNNRSLRTLSVDVEASYRLASRIPAHTVAVSESGLQSRADLEKLSAAGYRAFLIGERFMTDSDPASAIRALIAKDVGRVANCS